MFDPRDISSDPRDSEAGRNPRRDKRTDKQINSIFRARTERNERLLQEAASPDQRARFSAGSPPQPAAQGQERNGQQRDGQQRNGHRREYDPTAKRQSFQDRTDRAIADVGMYRNVAYSDVVHAHFGGNPYAARRASIRWCDPGKLRSIPSRDRKAATIKC